MLHHEQGNAPGIATPIRKTVNALASKLTVSQIEQHSDFTADGDISATGEASQLRHLQRQYERAGLNLYPLDGDSLLVVHQHYGMSRAMSGMREASLYLRQIGGAL